MSNYTDITKKGIFWNTLGGLMFGANSFIMITVVGQLSSIEETGYFGIAFTTAQLLYIVGLMGVNVYQMTDFNGKFGFSTYLRTRIFSCICMCIFCLIATYMLQFKENKLIYTLLLTVIMLGNALGDVYQNQFFRKKDLAKSGSALFFRTFFSLIVFIVVFYISKNLIFALLGQIVMVFLVVGYYAKWVAPIYLLQEANVSLDDCKQLVRECFPLFLSMFAMNVIINISRYNVDFYLDDMAQGYYSMIFIVAQGINLCVQFLFTPFLSTYSKAFEENGLSELQNKARKQFVFIGCLTILASLASYILGAQILGIIYHKNLLGLKREITLLTFGGGIFAITQLYYYIFTILRWQKLIFRIYLRSILIAFLITSLLVKYGGLFGAVLSFVLAHIIIFVQYLRQLNKT